MFREARVTLKTLNVKRSITIWLAESFTAIYISREIGYSPTPDQEPDV
jgi:hypothetical protein